MMGIRYSGSKDSVGRMTQWPTFAEALVGGSGGGGGEVPYENVNCLQFDGTEYSSTFNASTYNFDYNEPFSLSLWIKSSQTAGGGLCGNWATTGINGLSLNVQATTSYLIFNFANSFASNRIIVPGTASVRTGAWVHVVATYTGSTFASGVALYKNNVDVTGTPTGDTLTATTVNSQSFMFGNYGPAGLAGLMAQFTLWDKALSLSEVEALYNSGSPDDPRLLSFYETNCIGWFPMGNMQDVFRVNVNQIAGKPHGVMTNMVAGDIVVDAP